MSLLRAFAVPVGLAAGMSSAAAKDPCAGYKECRSLTRGEIALAKSFFGSTLDYGKIRVINARFMGMFPLGKDGGMSAPNGNIYAGSRTHQSADYSKTPQLSPHYLHEMSHVAQRQRGKNVIAEAIPLHIIPFYDPYKFRLEAGKKFSDFNIEQQAEIVQKLYIYEQYIQKNGQYGFYLGMPTRGEACLAWRNLNTVLQGFIIPRKPPRLCR